MWLSLSLYTLLVIAEFAKFDIIKITDNDHTIRTTLFIILWRGHISKGNCHNKLNQWPCLLHSLHQSRGNSTPRGEGGCSGATFGSRYHIYPACILLSVIETYFVTFALWGIVIPFSIITSQSLLSFKVILSIAFIPNYFVVAIIRAELVSVSDTSRRLAGS